MYKSIKHSQKSCYFAAGLLALSQAALAQEGGGRLSIEEIIVTAQKRAESLQEVPITISAFNSALLDRTGVADTDDLTVVVPGLQMGRQIGSSAPFLRGIGTQNSSAGDESSIPTYIDGVFMSSMVASVQSFSNVERIEVLKGPQGTLFGRNATGGLIHIITKDPQQEFSANVRASYGSYDTINTSFYATGGITDNVAADIAISYANQGEGYGKNLTTGNDINKADIHSNALRSNWLIDFSENTQARLSLDYAERKENTAIARQPAPGVIGVDGVTTFSGDFYDIQANGDSFTDSESWGASLKITHEFGNVDLVSISAYRENESLQLLDQDATPANIILAPLQIESEFFSQEIQLLSTYESDLQWLLGLYYMNDTSKYNPFELGGLGVAPAQRFMGFPTQDTESYAAFAQATYTLTDNTSITAGLRFTRDERELDVSRYMDLGVTNMVLPQIQRSESWTEPTWRLSIDHRLTDGVMAFASYSRGFKSGVYNTAGILSVAGTVGPVDPEVLDAYEIGVKADLLDNRMRFNASVFYYEFTDMQLTRIDSGITQLLNAAEAEVLGAELDLTAVVTENLELRVGLSVLDSEYTSFPGAPITQPDAGQPVTIGDASGNKLIRAPDYTFNVGATYEVPTEYGIVGTTVNYYYNDGFFWEPENRLAQDSYSILNAEISWASPDEKLRLSIFGKNLTDDEYSFYANSGGFGDLVSAGAPRTGGFAVEYNF
ncbi:MAG: TonB-dependent receptor [Porticoccaceae bacterium]